jgi:hypothetical protein
MCQDTYPAYTLRTARQQHRSRFLTIDSQPIYGGISLVSLEGDSFDLGHGVSLTSTYAHLMAPFLMAFSPAPPGGHHPEPWTAASDGLGFDIKVQLHVPATLKPPAGINRLNTVWLIAALMRLKISHLVQVPVISDQPYAAIPSSKKPPRLIPIEVMDTRLMAADKPSTILDADGLSWIREHWYHAGELFDRNDDFSAALMAYDAVTLTNRLAVAMMMLWGAIEQLFSPANYELRFRTSALLASFLESPGPPRLALHKQLTKLYDKRSEVAHGAARGNPQAFQATYAIMSRALIKIIEQNHVPSRAELEALLFGC